MKHIFFAITSLSILLPFAGADDEANWPGFRGPGARGTAFGFDTPESWDAADPDDKAILWKTSVPGLGHSSPTIFGDQIFLATAVSESGEAPLQVGRGGNIEAADDNEEQSWLVLCYDKQTGSERWRKTARTGKPKASRHTKATHANTTIAVDDKHVVAFFGSEGLFCYDHSGKLLWEQDLGVVNVSKYGIGWGYGSSPAIYGDQIVLVCDDPDNPYIVSLNLSDGEERWRKSREGDCERSWGTPFIQKLPDAAQVVVNGWPWIVSYDLETGDERWRIEGGGDNPTPTPFAVDDRIYITNSHGGKSPIYAIRSDAMGNLSEESEEENNGVVWREGRGGSYMSTPVVWGDYLYLGNTNGTIRCYHAVTGAKVYEKRLGSGACITASLVAADDKIYCPSEDGTMFVVQAGPEFKLLARNNMAEPCFATPAISNGLLYVRTSKSLCAVQKVAKEVEAVNATPSAKRPNVLFIAVDDLRPSIGCYGDEHAITPNIDKLAGRGVQFNQAYCQVAVCNPSRASLMAGLRPDKLGVWTLPIHFREAKPDAVTMPQWFRKSGYTAVSHGKIYHNPTPDPQSWSEPIRSLPPLPPAYPDGTRDIVKEAMTALPAKDWRKNNLRNPSTAAPDLPDNQLLDGARTDMAIEDLRRLAEQPEPFFLAMGYIRPHLAWVAPKKYWDMHDPAKLPVLTDQRVTPNTPQYALSNNSELSHYVDLIDFPKPWDEQTIAPEKARHLMHAYYACVSYIDAQIGRLLTALDESGQADNTIIVLWSDHGWKLGEYKGWGKMSNYEIDTRVPLLIAGPGVTAAGQQSNQLVELLDLYPTLCDMAGIEVPDFIDGSSLVPNLNDVNAEVHQAAISQYYRKLNGSEYMGYTIRTQDHRLVEWRDFLTGEVTDQELYRHDSEHSETENVIDSTPEDVVQKLTAQLLTTHPRKKLVMTPAIHSSPSPGRWPAKMSFLNQHTSDIKVIPITPAGRRGKTRTMKPGEKVEYQARIGGVYVVESVDGKIYEIHSPSVPAKVVTIK